MAAGVRLSHEFNNIALIG